LAIEVLEFALVQWIEEVKSLTVLAVTLWSEWLAMSVFVLTLVVYDFVSLLASHASAWLEIVFNTVGVTSATQSILEQIVSETADTLFVISLQTVLDHAMLVFIEFEWVLALFAVVEVMFETSRNVAFVLP
jgi:hypothetical protein